MSANPPGQLADWRTAPADFRFPCPPRPIFPHTWMTAACIRPEGAVTVIPLPCGPRRFSFGAWRMATFTQTQRPLAVTTPLGADKLLLVGFSGTEALSKLFHFDLDLVAENATDVAFDKLLGQPIGVRLEMPKGTRQFHGICVGVRQGGSDETFTSYHLEVVPQFWLWTKRVQS